MLINIQRKKEEDIVKFYSVVAGLPLPKRVSDIIDEITRIKEEREQANSKKIKCCF